MTHFFEALMLIAFGLSWPISIIKTLRIKKVMGKSPLFMTLIIGGYLCGIIDKMINHNITPVIWLYLLNTIMVAFDLGLYFYYTKKNAKNLTA